MKTLMRKVFYVMLSCFMFMSSLTFVEVAAATGQVVNVLDYGADPSGVSDSTIAFQKALEAAKELESDDEMVRLVIPHGEYHIYKDYASKREYHTSNTNSIEHPIKTVGFLIEDHKNLIVEGNDSVLMMHGNMMAFAIVHSENITVNDFGWDFAVPTVSEMTITGMGNANGKAYTDYYIPACFPYEISGNSIIWNGGTSPYTGEYYWTQRNEHNTYGIIIHNPDLELTANYAVGGNTPFGGVSSIEKIENGVRIYYNSRPNNQVLGAVYELCGSSVRETAGAFTWESKNVTCNNVSVHYMHGFGWLMQMSEDLYYYNCNFMPRKNSGHITVSFADILHASGSKGDIVIDGCQFSSSHDDPINLHGTFTRVESINSSNNTATLKYIHAQQGGFPQYHVGDKVQFFTRDTLQSTDNEKQYTVAEVLSNPGENGNDLRTMVVRFEESLPSNLTERVSGEPRYVAENVTYAPKVTIRNSTFKNVPTRGILCTTRNEVIIENNVFLNMSMATIFLSNDSNQWYESGPIRNMTIRGNTFYIKNKSYPGWSSKPAILIHPVVKSNSLPAKNQPVHKNITIDGNTFYMENDMVVQAECVENLTITNNKILRRYPNVNLTLSAPQSNLTANTTMQLNLNATGSLQNDSAVAQNVYNLTNCSNVTISGNTYDDGMKRYVVLNGMNQSDVNLQDEEVQFTTSSSTSPSAAVANVKYYSSDNEVASVNKDGIVTAKKAGTTTVYAAYEWNGTLIRSNKVELTVSATTTSTPLKFRNPSVMSLRSTDSGVLLELENGDDATFELKDFPGYKASDILTLENDVSPVITAKSNGLVWVSASGSNGSDQILVIVSLPETNSLNSAFSITRKDDASLALGENSAEITMIKGDLYQTDGSNNLKNLILYNVPSNTTSFAATVTIDGMPIRENNQWDTASFILYGNDDNYLTIGKKSHYDGFATVVEQNGSAQEAGGSSSFNNVAKAELGIFVNGTNAKLYYKQDGTWVEAKSQDISFLGSNLKIGMGAWASNLRNKKATFSNFKFVANATSMNAVDEAEELNFLGEVNEAPVITSKTASGRAVVGSPLTVNFNYTDAENDELAATYYVWTYEKDGLVYRDVTTTNTITVPETDELSLNIIAVDAKGTPSDETDTMTFDVSSTNVDATNEWKEIVINGINALNGSVSLPKETTKLVVEYNYDGVADVEVLYNGESYTSSNKGTQVFDVDTEAVEVVLTVNGERKVVNLNYLGNNEAKLTAITSDVLNMNETTFNGNYTFTTTTSNTIDLNITKSTDTKDVQVLYGHGREALEVNQEHGTYKTTATLVNGLNTFYVKAIAEDGISEQQHIIAVVYQPACDALVESITLNGKSLEDFDVDTHEYRVDYDETVETLSVKATGSKKLVYIFNNTLVNEAETLTLNNGVNTLVVRAIAEDGITTNDYQITMVKAYASNVDLISFELANQDILGALKDGEYEFAVNANKPLVKIEAEDPQARIIVSSAYESKEVRGTFEDTIEVAKEDSTIHVQIIARDGRTMKKYLVNVYKAAYLSDLTYASNSTVGYGSIMKDQSTDGNPLRLINENGQPVPFEKGIGTHATSTIYYDLSAYDFTRLTGYAGLDYEVYGNENSSITFGINVTKNGSDTQVFATDELRGTSPMQPIDIDLTDVTQLTLKATEGTNNWSDHADWAEMKLYGALAINPTETFLASYKVRDGKGSMISNYGNIVAKGSTVKVEFVPEAGYKVKDVYVNDIVVPVENNMVVIENVSETLNVEVVFVEGTYVNKTALKNQIDVAANIENNQYSAETYAVFTSAYEAAQTVYANDDATQEAVDQATNALKEAIAGLKVTVDKSALAAKLAEAKDIDTSNYSDDSVQVLNDAITAAEAVYVNAEATQGEVNRQVTALTNAMNQLEIAPPKAENLINKSANSAVHVESCDSQYPGETADKTLDYDPSTHWHSNWNGSDELPISITYDLGEVYDLTDLTFLARQDGSVNGDIFEFDLYVGEEANDMTSLGHFVMKTEGSGTSEAIANKASFQRVMFNATGRYVKMTITRSGCDDGRTNMFTSMAEIRFYGTEATTQPSADKAALNALIAEVEALAEADYSRKSWSNLQTALTAAKDVAAENATQEVVDQAKAELEAKQAALVNVAAMRKAIAAAEAKLAEADKYTDETVATLTSVYNNAVYALNSNIGYVQADANMYATNINNAISALIEKPVEPEIVAPAKVENVKAKDTNYKTITLTWDASEGATAYEVYRKAWDSEEFKLYKTVADTTLKVSGVITGKKYAFYVVAKNDSCAAEASATVAKATTLHGKVTLDIDQVSTSTFKLSWNKIDGATRYIVYRKRNNDKMKKVLTLSSKETKYTTAELPNGDYQFILKAGRYDSTNRVMTKASNTVKGSVKKVAPAVTLKAGTKSVKVSWKKVEGVTHYQVYRATSKDGKYTKLITTKELSYTAKSLSRGKKYFFKVRGYKLYKSGEDIKYNVYTPYSTIKYATAK